MSRGLRLPRARSSCNNCSCLGRSTSFFPFVAADRDAGIIKITPRPAGESAQQLFNKIYLAPFSDDQVKTYLKRRFPIWRRKRRKQAFDIVAKIPMLTDRPMLLANIEVLVKSNRVFHFSYELYEEIVEAWLIHETKREAFINEPEVLRDFSERLAVDLYLNRATRGAERIPKDELREMATEWCIPISDQKLSGRSLLSRDANGNFRFAHRSIMEYLFVRRCLNNEPRCLTIGWADQMNRFMLEIFQRYLGEPASSSLRGSFDSLSSDQQLEILRRVLTFAFRRQTLNPLDPRPAVPILQLCAMGLGLWRSELNLTLWIGPASKTEVNSYYHRDWEYPQLVKEIYTVWSFEPYFGFSLGDGQPQTVLALRTRAVPDRAVRLTSIPTEAVGDFDWKQAVGQIYDFHPIARFLVAPIFLEPDEPCYLLEAEDPVGFSEQDMELLSKILPDARKQPPAIWKFRSF